MPSLAFIAANAEATVMRGRVKCRALATVVSHYACDLWIYVVVCDVLELENRVHTHTDSPRARWRSGGGASNDQRTGSHARAVWRARGAGTHGSV